MIKINTGDIVMMKKGHPCGQNRWQVIRTGMDVKLKCLGCGRLIMMKHAQFKKGLKRRLDDEQQ